MQLDTIYAITIAHIRQLTSLSQCIGLREKTTGNHVFVPQKRRFPLNFPMIQYWELGTYERL